MNNGISLKNEIRNTIMIVTIIIVLSYIISFLGSIIDAPWYINNTYGILILTMFSLIVYVIVRWIYLIAENTL